MAINTAARRYSILNFGRTPVFPLFIPDGSVDDGDRLHLLNLYSGIALSAVTPPVFSGDLSDLNIVTSREKIVDYSGYFSDATSYSISPAVEAGWSFNTSTGILTVTESDVSRYGSYVITGTNAGGSDDSNAFYIHVRAASVGGSYGIRPVSDYEKEIKQLLAKEKAKKLKEKRSLKGKETRLEKKIQKQDIRQKQESELKLLLISESLLRIEKDLIEIQRKRAQITKKARIMRDDDEVIMLLMSKGYL